METTDQADLEVSYTALLEAVKEACKMMRRCDYTMALSLLLTTLWEIENNG